MIWFDLVLLVLLIQTAVRGYRRGLLDQLLGVAVLIVALMCAKGIAPQLADYLSGWDTTYRYELGWFFSFLLLYSLGQVLRRLITRPRHRTGGGVDGIAGALFSLLLAIVTAAAGVGLWHKAATQRLLPLPQLPHDSIAVSYLLPISKTILPPHLLDLKELPAPDSTINDGKGRQIQDLL